MNETAGHKYFAKESGCLKYGYRNPIGFRQWVVHAMNHKQHYDMIYGSHEERFYLSICSIKDKAGITNETK